jgi:Tfp pilus assembly protein PilF
MTQQPDRRFAWAAVAVWCLLVNGGCLHNMPWSHSDPQSVPALADNATPAGTRERDLPLAQSAQLHLSLADKMEKSGHDAEAVACFEKARQCDSHVQVSRRLAPLYDRLGDNKHALEEYQKALKANPRDADLLNSLGYFYYTRGQWPEAEQTFRQALAINPNLPRAWTNLGLTLGQLGKYDECFAAFAKVVTEAEAFSNLGFIKTTQGKLEDAKQAYREALRLDPNLRIAQVALQKLESPRPRPSAARSDSEPQGVASIPAGSSFNLK